MINGTNVMNPTKVGVSYESLFGEVVERQADNTQSQHGASVPAFSTVAFIDPREGFCRGNDDTCGARAVKGKDLCVGHARSKK